MSLTRKVAYNTIIQVAGKVVSVALGVAVVAMMTRYLGREGFGYYSTMVAFLQVFGILVDFGLTLTTVQFLGEPGVNTERTLGAMLTLRLLSALLFLGIAPVIAFAIFPYPPVVAWGIAILSISFISSSVHQVLLGLFQRELRLDLTTLSELLGRVVLFGAVLFVTVFDSGLNAILFAIVAGALVNLGATLFFSRTFTRLTLTIDLALWRKFLSVSWPIGLSIAFNLLYLKSDTVILSLYHPPETVGLYGAPFRMLEILITLPFLFVGMVFPHLRHAWLVDRERFKRMLQKSFDALALLALPLVAGTLILGTPIMVFVAGDAFEASGPLVQILVIATGLIYLGTPFGHTVLIIEKQRQMLWAYAATAVIALVGYFLFIPPYGATGAAWMTVAAEGMIAIVTTVVTLRVARMRLSFTVFGKALSASLVMMVVLALFPSLPVLALTLIGALVYGGLILLFRTLSPQILRELLPKQTV